MEAERHKKVVLPPRPLDDPVQPVGGDAAKPPEPENDPPEPLAVGKRRLLQVRGI